MDHAQVTKRNQLRDELAARAMQALIGGGAPWVYNGVFESKEVVIGVIASASYLMAERMLNELEKYLRGTP